MAISFGGREAALPANTIRPGDLLGAGGVESFLEDRQSHETVGELVHACDVMAPVYIGWSMPFFVQSMMSPLLGSGHNAVVFGPRQIVIETFIDIRRHIETAIVGISGRSIRFDRGTILFAYLSDRGSLNGYHFNSVWIVGAGLSRAQRQAERRHREQEQENNAIRALMVREARAQAGRLEEVQREHTQRLQHVLDIMSRPIVNVTTTSNEFIVGPDGRGGQVAIDPNTGEAIHIEKEVVLVRFPEKRLFLKEGDE